MSPPARGLGAGRSQISLPAFTRPLGGSWPSNRSSQADAQAITDCIFVTAGFVGQMVALHLSETFWCIDPTTESLQVFTNVRCS